MPTMINLWLRAGQPVQADTRRLHGLACALFETAGDAPHDGQDKPFAVWPLQPIAARGQMMLRASWLADGPPPVRCAGTGLRLGAQPLDITEVERREAGRAELAGGPVLRAVTLAFRSPVFFSRNGTDDLTPDPRLILGSYRRHWNSGLGEGHPLLIGDGAWRDTHGFARLAGYELRTEAMDGGRGRKRAGFTGTVTLYLDTAAPRAAGMVFSTLARFAPFCGTGAQTTHGFGATELVACVAAAERGGRG